MPRVINPRYELKIFLSGIEPITEQYIDFDISKDTDEAPNELDLKIYNLNADNRDKMTQAGVDEAPIELYLTPGGVDELVLAYRGEVDIVNNINTQPGWETRLKCRSQNRNHREYWVDQKTFEKGTNATDIIAYFVKQISLPSQQIDFSDLIPVGQALSFNGPAFPLLKKFAENYGLGVYINDNVLYINDIYDPQDVTVYSIPLAALFQSPQFVSRSSRSEVRIEDISDKVRSTATWKKKKRRRKRKIKKYKRMKKTDYEEYDAVSKQVDGIDLNIRLQPDIQPDQLIQVEGNENIYRVKSVVHSGETEFFQEWSTEIEADIYDTEVL